MVDKVVVGEGGIGLGTWSEGCIDFPFFEKELELPNPTTITKDNFQFTRQLHISQWNIGIFYVHFFEYRNLLEEGKLFHKLPLTWQNSSQSSRLVSRWQSKWKLAAIKFHLHSWILHCRAYYWEKEKLRKSITFFDYMAQLVKVLHSNCTVASITLLGGRLGWETGPHYEIPRDFVGKRSDEHLMSEIDPEHLVSEIYPAIVGCVCTYICIYIYIHTSAFEIRLGSRQMPRLLPSHISIL